MEFNKKPKRISEQITLLKERGLKVEDEVQAEHFLTNVSYYRFSAYLLTFQHYQDPDHKYMEWATFQQATDLDVFWSKDHLLFTHRLRLIFFSFKNYFFKDKHAFLVN